MTILDERPSHYISQQLKYLPGHSLDNPSYKPRRVLVRHRDGRLLSGCGGDVEVFHPMELERSQNTGLPIRGTVATVFGGKDTVIGIKAVEGGDHFLVHGEQYCCLLHQSYLVEGGVVPEHRVLRLPSPIRSLNVERHGKNDLLLSFLLESGISHYSLSTNMEDTSFECLQCYRCTRPIQSGLLWRDGGILHVAYYDGFIRVGIIVEEYDDMLLVQRLSVSKNNVNTLLDVIFTEIKRLSEYEEAEREKRVSMLEKMKALKAKILDSPAASVTQNGEKEEDNDEIYAAHIEFCSLKVEFRNHSVRADRVSQRLIALRKLLVLSQKAIEAHNAMTNSISLIQSELDELTRFSQLHDQCLQSGDFNLIEKSRAVFEERKYTVQELMRKAKAGDMKTLISEWEKKVSNIIESMNGSCDSAKDMRLILSQHIFEHRAEKNDHFTHFLLDDTQREPTLYCLSGLTTLAVYPRKGKRVASISLDSSYETRLTAACLMRGVEGVYVTDDKEVFPIYFYREKRFFDAGNPISLPSFDHLTSILMEHDGMILGSGSGGLLHLAFDPERKYEHFIIASSLMAHPFSHGPINDLKILSTEDTYLALHCSDTEVVISERDHDRWHRVTYHSGGAICLASTPFSLDHRGAFAVTGSKTYVRIKALHYTEDNLVGLHDLGQSRVTDESGKDVEVLNVSLDPTMECRPLPCKLRYSVGYADKAIRTYVALLTGQHEFTVSEKFIAQIEPLHCVSLMICFHGRPMGCYAASGKTLQVWNDLDRHQQKKMKSERMELKKMEVAISSMARVEGRSCYLLLGYKDSRVQIFEERGKGTGKLDSVGWIDECHPNCDIRPVTVLRARVDPLSSGDRLFVLSMAGSFIFIHSALIEAGKLVELIFVLATEHEMACPRSFEMLDSRPFEFAVYGKGIAMHKLSAEERKRLEKYRDFEF
nr:CRE-DCT-6 protein [Haemonchus contortus]